MHLVTVSGAENSTFSFTHSVCVHLFVFTPVYASAKVNNIWVCLSLFTHLCECFSECARVYVCVWNRDQDACIYFKKKKFVRACLNTFEDVHVRLCPNKWRPDGFSFLSNFMVCQALSLREGFILVNISSSIFSLVPTSPLFPPPLPSHFPLDIDR